MGRGRGRDKIVGRTAGCRMSRVFDPGLDLAPFVIGRVEIAAVGRDGRRGRRSRSSGRRSGWVVGGCIVGSIVVVAVGEVGDRTVGAVVREEARSWMWRALGGFGSIGLCGRARRWGVGDRIGGFAVVVGRGGADIGWGSWVWRSRAGVGTAIAVEAAVGVGAAVAAAARVGSRKRVPVHLDLVGQPLNVRSHRSVHFEALVCRSVGGLAVGEGPQSRRMTDQVVGDHTCHVAAATWTVLGELRSLVEL